MTSPGRLRSFAGSCKFHLLDKWPYFWTNRQMPQRRRELQRSLASLPPVAGSSQTAAELHMLCGHRDHDMGIWSSWSLLRQMDGLVSLYVHSDGSLTPDDVALWKTVVPDLVLVPRDEADAKVAELFQFTNRHLLEWRQTYRTSPQLVDFHLFGSTPVVIGMDSDILVFRRPDEVISLLKNPDSGMHWCDDGRPSYSADPEILRELTGVLLPAKFNCGFLVSPRFSLEHFHQLEQMLVKLKQDPRVDINRYWACQTYHALLINHFPGSSPLPPAYTTNFGSTPRDCILRHFVGVPKVRFRYFTEGLPKLLAEAAKNHF